MKAYVCHAHGHASMLGKCTQAAVAEQQGVNSEQEERKAWLAVFDTAAAAYPVVFTTAGVQDIFKPDRQIAWMMQEGYVLVSPDAAQTSTPTPVPAPASTLADVTQLLRATGELKGRHQ
jgi:hypothetical protein